VLSKVLDYLNFKNLQKPVPSEIRELYDRETVEKTRAYEQARLRFSTLVGALSLVVLLAMLLLDGFAWLDEWVRQYTEHAIAMALLFFGMLFFASDLLHLPFSLYSTFVIEEKFGFNQTTPQTFALDKLKGWLLTVLIGGGLLALIIFIYVKTGQWFWLIAWAVVTGVSLFFTLFYTSLLLPLFNKLTPLEAGPLREAIEKYAAQVNFPLKNVFVMDGSKRSTKANAFFSGIGGKKSIVLFDTLIEKHRLAEVVSILAHEVGHYKKKHVQQGFVISTVNTGILLFLFGWLAGWPVLAEILGAEKNSFHLALLAFGLLYSPVSLLTGLALNALSRKKEYQADRFAKQTADATALQQALKRLSKDHLSHFNPHPAYVFVHYSHPPVTRRLRHLQQP